MLTLAQAYVICAWFEAILYGINCMLFGWGIQVLTSRATSRRVLAAAVVQFSLSTAHVIISLIKLLQAFAQGVDPNAYYSNPSANTIFIVGFYIYIVNTYVQELLLIWRLYSLWEHNFKVCIIPSIFWVGHVCTATITISSFIPTSATASTRNVFIFGLAAWGLETATNLAASFGIAYRLWRAERRTASLGTQKHLNYQSTMLLIVECGALITTCTVVLLGLFASGYESAIAGINIAAQIATVSPLLIVVRVGRAQTPQSTRSGRAMGTYPLEISVLRTENTFSECTSHGARKPRGGSLRDGAKSDPEEAL